jgi:nitrite reductase (NADH) large subunit
VRDRAAGGVKEGAMSTTSDRRPERLVVVGAGMAGARLIEEIVKRDPDRFAITLIGAEPRTSYDRIQLSPVLAGEKSFSDIVTHSEDWFAERGVTTRFGDAVTIIDRERKLVGLASRDMVAYDVLVLALGSNPVKIPLTGVDLPGVISFRDIDDVDAMLRAAESGGRAVVIGGGLLGLEAAYGLVRRGMDVTVLHKEKVLMERQLDEAAGRLLEKALTEKGVEVVIGADTETILGDQRVLGVRLADGREIDADIVVMAVGIRPCTKLAVDAGIAINRGILVDDGLATSDPAIFAVGECIEHRGLCYGLVAPIWEMCRTLADRLTGAAPQASYQGSQLATRLKVSGVDVYSAGRFAGGDGCEDIVFRDAARGVYKRVVVENERIVGAVLFGEAIDGGWYFDLMKRSEPIAEIRETLVFGQAVTEALAGQDPRSAVAGWPDAAEVCGCNGVTKGVILGAIGEHGLTSIEGVRACTKASGSCGSCTPLVEQLLKLALGDGYAAPTGPKSMCACTMLGHKTVREAIVTEGFATIPDVMQGLEWSTPDGCSSCRPALNYYLLCAAPESYVDDPRSRFVNERNHANIQKDGTYSVIPRMWGGQTSAKELRAIADVVEKFAIPTVKVTGGQRLDLLGVKKEDLPAVWADLGAAGMVSGHAYGKALRTVKTCVGSDWCRFGTQDSTGLGVKLEQATWGSWMPHKFKMAVSGCPRNCAEATIKDFGVVCVDSGYELHVGGNGGIKVRATDLLCKVATEEAAIEHCLAFVQLYREDAFYLERTAPWLERVGLDFIKARVVDDAEERAALAERFAISQRVFQKDPWAERAPGKAEARAFAPLARIGMGAAAE